MIVFDLEIAKPIAECKGGWTGYEEMGVSVGACFDYRNARYSIFMDDNIGGLVERLNEPNTLIVAFNHIGFDNCLLRGNGLPLNPDEALRNFDLLHISRQGAGLDKNAKIKGFKLDDHLEAMKLPMKLGNGADAPKLWQEKRLGELITYTINDVHCERALFEYAYVHGRMACKYKPEGYEVELPTWI